MTTDTHNWRLHCRFTLRSPLSHIGETISTTAYLVEEPVLSPRGAVESVFSYSGNAWRGQLRDLMASDLLARLANPTVALDAFHLLYSGGAIGGTQQTNLDKARQMRRAIVPIALLGGGVGNQVLPGKMRVSNFYPACLEAPLPLYAWPNDPRGRVSYRELTTEKSFSRKDDSKDPRYAAALEPPQPALTQGTLMGAPEPEPSKRKATGEAAQQMRMTVELLIAGTQLMGHIDLLDTTETELGCLVAALEAFARSPHIGGQASRGHGLTALETILVDLDTGELVDPFLTVADGARLSPPAERARDAYAAHCQALYAALVDERQPQIRALIGAVA